MCVRITTTTRALHDATAAATEPMSRGAVAPAETMAALSALSATKRAPKSTAHRRVAESATPPRTALATRAAASSAATVASTCLGVYCHDASATEDHVPRCSGPPTQRMTEPRATKMPLTITAKNEA